MLGANTEVTPERIAAMRAALGLDQPLIVQYVDWIGRALAGDLGRSIWTGRPVADEIAIHVWPTLQLAAYALILGAGLAVPLGCLMAQWRGRRADLVLRIVAIAGLTVPSFWLGIVMLVALASLAPGFAALGYVPFSQDPLGNLQRLALPALALALPILANLSRLVRTAMLDALSQDYVRTARAKGASETRVLYVHALRNALIPFVTSVGIMAGYLIGGAIVVEQVFAIPGLGRLILGAISERNYPVVQATILVVTVGFVLVNFLVDLAYALIDPRLRR
jgi:peptide/nickel transport system permease protein